MVDGECQFTATNDGNVAIDITINFPDHTGGDASTNSNSGYGTNGASSFGASSYISGLAWPGGAVTLQASGSSVSIDALAASGTKKFGIAYKAQSGAWTSATAMNSTVALTAVEDS